MVRWFIVACMVWQSPIVQAVDLTTFGYFFKLWLSGLPPEHRCSMSPAPLSLRHEQTVCKQESPVRYALGDTVPLSVPQAGQTMQFVSLWDSIHMWKWFTWADYHPVSMQAA